MKKFVINVHNETVNLYDKMNTIIYIFGLPGFWVEDVKLPRKFTKIFDVISFVLHILCVIYAGLQFFAIFTQKNLSDKQRSDTIVIGLANPMSHLFTLTLLYKRNEVKELLYYLAVVLKRYHNDVEIERSMILKINSKVKAFVLTTIMVLGSSGVSGLFLSMKTGQPFLAIITAWPDIDDTSNLATYARIGFYLFWFIYFYRVSTVFVILLCILSGLTNQYKILCRYFEGLDEIFKDISLSREAQEIKFEAAFINGIKIHSQTIWCVRRCQNICRGVFSGHIILSTAVLIILMLAIVNTENDFEGLCSQLASVMLTFIIMAFFMWTSGDITIEASKLPAAIYGSGWYNCRDKSSVRIRSLVTVAINKAQQPMVLQALGFFELSHENFVAVIKSAYSVFSVFY